MERWLVRILSLATIIWLLYPGARQWWRRKNHRNMARVILPNAIEFAVLVMLAALAMTPIGVDLEDDGELSVRIRAGFGSIEPGDVVIVENGGSRALRLLARPGDHFTVDEGLPLVNGEDLPDELSFPGLDCRALTVGLDKFVAARLDPEHTQTCSDLIVADVEIIVGHQWFAVSWPWAP